MEESKWFNRMMHIASFSLGVIVTALMLAKGWFDQFLYVLLGSVLVLFVFFVTAYVRGVDHMQTHHPDYKGEDLFEEDEA